MLASLYKKAAANAVETGPVHPPDRLHLQVIYTDPKGTRSALRAAHEFGRGLDACVTLIVAQVVPYPLPIDEPVVASRFTQNALIKLLTDQEDDTCVRIYLCRDRSTTIREALAPKSIVILGGRRFMGLSRTDRLARTLQRDRHKVIYINPSRSRTGLPMSSPTEIFQHESIDLHS